MPEIVDKQESGEKYKNVQRPMGKMLYYNFIGGIAWGLGVLIGSTIIFALIAFFIGKVDFVPLFGQFAAKVIESAQFNLQSP